MIVVEIYNDTVSVLQIREASVSERIGDEENWRCSYRSNRVTNRSSTVAQGWVQAQEVFRTQEPSEPDCPLHSPQAGLDGFGALGLLLSGMI